MDTTLKNARRELFKRLIDGRRSLEVGLGYMALSMTILTGTMAFVFPQDLEPFLVRWVAILFGFLPFALLSVRPYRGFPSIDVQFAGIMIVLTIIQVAVPTARTAMLLGFLLLVALRTALRGARAGMVLAVSALGATIGATVLQPYPGGPTGFELVVFTGVTFASTLILHGVRRDQEQEDHEGTRRRVGTLGHELRTPLTSISGFASTLAARWDNIGEDDRRLLVAQIAENARQMNLLTERLLEFALNEASLTNGTPAIVDLRGSVENYLMAHAPALREHPVHVEVPSGLSVRLAPGALHHILGNLLSNAVRYSPDEAPVSVTAIPMRDEVLISVSDEGPGIGVEEIERIFDPFYQTGPVNKQGGAGIGLSVVREQVERHGGRIWVESTPGEGATFVFTLPRAVKRPVPDQDLRRVV